MSLRDEAITHMAQALAEANGVKHWDAYIDMNREPWRIKGAAALDALLDFLDAHTEEWIKASGAGPVQIGVEYGYRIETAPELVAALRGTTEEGNEGEEL